MTLRTMALLVGCALSASSEFCCAQESEHFPDSALTGEQWQQRVQDARRRSEEFVANARTRTADPPPSDGTGKQVLLLAFHPSQLAPGRYALRVFVEDSSAAHAAQNTAPFLVR